MDSLQFNSDSRTRKFDTIEVCFYGYQRWLTYNIETGKHDIPGETTPPRVVITINEWEQVVLEKEKVKLLVESLNKFLEL